MMILFEMFEVTFGEISNSSLQNSPQTSTNCCLQVSKDPGEGGYTDRVFIRHQRLENSPVTTQNSPSKLHSFIIILQLLYTILLLVQFLMKTMLTAGCCLINNTHLLNVKFLHKILTGNGSRIYH